MKTNLFIIMLILLYSCNSQKPIATTHTERIEERVMPVAVGADTIEIVLSHMDNTEDIKTCLLGRDFAQQKQDHYVKEKSSYVFLSKNPTNIASQNNSSFYRQRLKDLRFLIPHSSLRSTRPISLQTHHTDTSTRIRLTLQPDTVFLPYTHHIRSDTIVVPDRVCQQKLNHLNMTNLFLILILIAMLMLAVRRAKLV